MTKNLLRYLLGLAFIAAGLNHFWHASFYVAMIPAYLPLPEWLVAVSGVAEAGAGALLLFERTRRLGGWAVIAVCVAVFPANVQMALHPQLYPQFSPAALWLRLPLQLLPIAWAWWVACRPERRA
jgi:uncharacterized membrane protein